MLIRQIATTSTEWGSPAAAAVRALAETDTTKANSQLIRTFHPAFSCLGGVVSLLCRADGSRAWAVCDATHPIPYAHAGGLPIHFMPSLWDNMPIGIMVPGGQARQSLFARPINPRRLLSSEDLDRFRCMYPRACGVRIFLCGVIQVLYPTRQAMTCDFHEFIATNIGGSPVCFDIMDCHPSHSLSTGDSVTKDPISQKSKFCIGLRLILPDKRAAITTVTHGFARSAGVSTLVGRTMDCIWTVKDALTKFRTTSRTDFVLPYASPVETPTSNTPLGEKVWLCGNARLLGTISATFDSPSNCRPYPAGYTHDLSLITAAPDQPSNQLPRVDSPAGLPVIDGWARAVEALEGKPLFVTSTVICPNGNTIYGEVLDEATRKLLQNQVEEVLAEGTQYSWDPTTRSQSVALLWRVVPDPKTVSAATTETRRDDLHYFTRPAGGYSGSVVCLGKPTDKTAKAIVLQNFEVMLPTGKAIAPAGGHETTRLVDIKGGFVLPTFIYDACTLDHAVCGLPDTDNKYATFPERRNPTASTRRSFSGMV